MRFATLVAAALLVASKALAAPAPVLPTAAILPPRGTELEANDLGLLIQDRATGILEVSGAYQVLHIKQILSMADREELALSSIDDDATAKIAGHHLGASRIAYASLKSSPQGWTLTYQASTVPSAVGTARQKLELPSDLALAVDLGGKVLAQAVATLDRVKLTPDALPPATLSAKAMAGYEKCYPVVVRQPIGIENPTVLLDSELSLAALGCQVALEADPQFQDAQAALALAFAIRGDDAKAVKVLTSDQPPRAYLPFRELARFWLATRYVSSASGTAALRESIGREPGLLLLRGYLGEHLNALGDQAGALQAWDSYLRASPGSDFALAKQAYTLAKLGKNAEAKQQTEAALKDDPQSLVLKVELASRQIDAGEPKLAVATLTPVVESGSGGADLMLRLGEAMLLTEQYAGAEFLFRRVLTDSKRPTEWRARGRAHLDLAKIQHRRHQDDEAVASIREALKEGYKPAMLASEDASLMPLMAQAQLGGPSGDHPKEASPFAVTATGDIQPNQARPPPPAGLAQLHFTGVSDLH